MIHNLHKHLGDGNKPSTVSNETVASVQAVTTTQDLPKNPKENEVYHVNGVDWVFVKGEWVTRQGIYGHEDFGDAHEPLWDGTGEKPNIEDQRAESPVSRELSDEPAIKPEDVAPASEPSVHETPAMEEPEAEVVETVVEETPSEAPVEPVASEEAEVTDTETVIETSEPEPEAPAEEPTVHEQVEAHEAAANPEVQEEESETTDEEKPANENVDAEPLAHPVAEVEPLTMADVEVTEGEQLMHDRIQMVSGQIDSMHDAQTALEAYYDVLKGQRVTKQAAAVLHTNLKHIDATFGLKAKATGLESFDTTPRSAMESADVDSDTITGRMKQLGGAIYKKLQELWAKIIEMIKNFDPMRQKSEAKVTGLLQKLEDTPRNAVMKNEKIKVSSKRYFYADGKFVGVDPSSEVAVVDLAVSAAMALQSNVVYLGQALSKAEATQEGVEAYKAIVAERLEQQSGDVIEKPLAGGGKIVRKGHALELQRSEGTDEGEDLDALDRREIEKGLKELQKFFNVAGKTDRVSRIITAARDKSQESIKATRNGGDERYTQELQQVYVTAINSMVRELNLILVTSVVSQTAYAKALYLEACLENLVVKGAGMESHCHMTFSNEGLFSEIGHFFNAIINGSKEDLVPERYLEAKAKIAKTFGNASWLKNRRFIEGDVKFKGDPSLDENFKRTIAKAVGSLDQSSRGNSAVFTRATNAVKPFTDFLIKMEYRNHPEKTQKMFDQMPSFDRSKYPVVKYSSGMAHSYSDITKPAMSAELVAEAAQEIIRAIDYVEDYWEKSMGKAWWETFNVVNEHGLYSRFIPAYMGDTGKYPDVIRNIANYTKGEEQKWAVKLAAKIADYGNDGENHFMKDGGGQWEFYFTYIRGLMNWMDASTR